MRRSILIIALAISLLGASYAAEPRTVSFEGEYQWGQGGDGPLTAEFSATGENSWKVEYRFRWNGNGYKWRGEARGTLENGSDFSGTATNKSGRTWKIRGRVEEGVLTATHVETTDGRDYETGTIRLRR